MYRVHNRLVPFSTKIYENIHDYVLNYIFFYYYWLTLQCWNKMTVTDGYMYVNTIGYNYKYKNHLHTAMKITVDFCPWGHEVKKYSFKMTSRWPHYIYLLVIHIKLFFTTVHCIMCSNSKHKIIICYSAIFKTK